MPSATPVADMCSGTGGLSTALRATLRTPATLASLSDAAGGFVEWMMPPTEETALRAARIRLAGNAVGAL